MSTHVIPRRDIIAHALDDDCVCIPRMEPVKRPDGSMVWLAVHHSLDGREQREDDGRNQQ